MWNGKEELLFDLVTREALLIWRGEVHRLEGPFESRSQAQEAAEDLKRRVADVASDKAA